MTLSPRDRRAILLGAAVLLIIVAARVVVMPWIGRWRSARDQMTSTRSQLNDIQGQVRRVLWQRQRLEEIYGPAVKNPLEDRQTAQLSLIKAVQDVFKAGGIKLTDYQPQRARTLKEIPDVQIVPLQIRGKCTVSQLTKCFVAMRDAQTLIIVESFSVTNNEKKPGELEITMIVSTLAEQEKAKS